MAPDGTTRLREVEKNTGFPKPAVRNLGIALNKNHALESRSPFEAA